MISTDLLLALLGGAIAGGGLLLLVAALVGWAPADRPGPSLADRISPGNLGRRLALGAALGALALLVSGWLVVAVGVGVLGFFGTALFGGATQGRRELANLEQLLRVLARDRPLDRAARQRSTHGVAEHIVTAYQPWLEQLRFVASTRKRED